MNNNLTLKENEVLLVGINALFNSLRTGEIDEDADDVEASVTLKENIDDFIITITVPQLERRLNKKEPPKLGDLVKFKTAKGGIEEGTVIGPVYTYDEKTADEEQYWYIRPLKMRDVIEVPDCDVIREPRTKKGK